MDYLNHLISLFLIFGIAALSQNLMLGYTGIVFVGAAAFMGIGAYTSAILALNWDMPLYFSIPIAVFITMIIGVLVFLLFKNLKKDYLALATLGAGLILYDIYHNWMSVTRGPLGLPGIPLLAENVWHLLLVELISIAFAFVAFVMIAKSHFGSVLRAIRDDEELVHSIGQPTFLPTMIVYVVSFAFLGLSGAYLGHYLTYVDPSSFTLNDSIAVLAMVIIGGTESQVGALLGAAVFIFLPEALRFLGLPPALAAQFRQGLFGLALILLMIYRPQGILGKYRLQ